VVGPETTNFFGVEVPRFYAGQPALSRIQADSAWSLSSGAGARIAYIDTGVDPGHPALAPWVEPGVDLVNGVSASEFDGLSAETMYLLDTDRTIPLGAETMFLLDRRFSFLFDRSLISTLAGASEQAVPPAFGHGTLVAGVLHAVAPEARIVPIKAFDAYGNTTLFTIVEAVHRAVDMDVDVLNMSFSTRVSSEALRRAVLRAYGAGIGMAASAGNEGANMQDVYPAAYNMVFAVSATDLNDRLAAFSNYGKLVAVSAPGVAVVSTVPGGRYGAAWGTSFGAPMVSGAMALRAARFPQGQSVARIVVNSADAIDELNPAFKGELGTGRLNVRRALER
jgi:subtilisin family serine protease